MLSVIPVTSFHNAFIVNIEGNNYSILPWHLLFIRTCSCALVVLTWLIITNGTYRNIEHCATENSVQERLFIATVYSVRYDSEVYPAASLISEKTPLFRRVTVEQYFRSLCACELTGKSHLDGLRIQSGQG